MILITVLRVSKESHSGVASPQPLSKSKTGKHRKTVRPSGKSFIGSLTGIFPIPTTRTSSVTGADVNPKSPLGVKLRRTQCEQMSSELLLKADIVHYSQHVSKV